MISLNLAQMVFIAQKMQRLNSIAGQEFSVYEISAWNEIETLFNQEAERIQAESEKKKTNIQAKNN